MPKFSYQIYGLKYVQKVNFIIQYSDAIFLHFMIWSSEMIYLLIFDKMGARNTSYKQFFFLTIQSKKLNTRAFINFSSAFNSYKNSHMIYCAFQFIFIEVFQFFSRTRYFHVQQWWRLYILYTYIDLQSKSYKKFQTHEESFIFITGPLNKPFLRSFNNFSPLISYFNL